MQSAKANIHAVAPTSSNTNSNNYSVDAPVIDIVHQLQKTSLRDVATLRHLLSALLRDTENDADSDIQNRVAAGQAGAVTILLALARNPLIEMEILQRCLLALRFVTKGDMKNIELATKDGAIEFASDLMKKYPNDAGIQKCCCMIFRSLTFKNADNQRLAMETGAGALVILAMKNHSNDPSTLSAACMAMQNITWLVPENRRLMEGIGVISVLLDSMRRCRNEIDVQRWACGAIQNLACCDSCSTKLIDNGALSLIISAMDAFPYDCTVQNYALGVCRNLSFLRENRDRVARCGVITYALCALENHTQNEEVTSSAFSFFCNVLSENQNNAPLVLEQANAIEVLFKAMATFKPKSALSGKFAQLLEWLAQGEKFICPTLKSVPQSSLKALAARSAAPQLCKCPSYLRMSAPLTVSSTAAIAGLHHSPGVLGSPPKQIPVKEPTKATPCSCFSLNPDLSSPLNDLLPSDVIQYLQQGQRCNFCDAYFFNVKIPCAVMIRKDYDKIWQLWWLCSMKCMKYLTQCYSSSPPPLPSRSSVSGSL